MNNLFRKMNVFCLINQSKVKNPSHNQNLSLCRLFRGVRYFIIAVIFTGCMNSVQSLEASDWMFQPSYFSHYRTPEEAKLYPQPESRSAYRRAYSNFTPGGAIQGGYRINRIFLRSGNSTDVTVLREDWFGIQP